MKTKKETTLGHFLGIGRRLLVRRVRAGKDWILAVKVGAPQRAVAENQEIKIIDPRDSLILSTVFDLAMTAYDILVIDFGITPKELNEKIMRLTGEDRLDSINAWLATCWLLARARHHAWRHPEKFTAARKKIAFMEGIRMIYGIEGDSDREEDPEKRQMGIISLKEITRQVGKSAGRKGW